MTEVLEQLRDLLQRRIRALEAELEHFDALVRLSTTRRKENRTTLEGITGGIMELGALARHLGVAITYTIVEPTADEDDALYPSTALADELLRQRDS